jgi:hypothetical protein
MPHSGYCLLNIPTALARNEPSRTAPQAWELLTKDLTHQQREVLDGVRYLPDLTNRELAVNNRCLAFLLPPPREEKRKGEQAGECSIKNCR